MNFTAKVGIYQGSHQRSKVNKEQKAHTLRELQHYFDYDNIKRWENVYPVRPVRKWKED